jgi:hypothetical protein
MLLENRAANAVIVARSLHPSVVRLTDPVASA